MGPGGAEGKGFRVRFRMGDAEPISDIVAVCLSDHSRTHQAGDRGVVLASLLG